MADTRWITENPVGRQTGFIHPDSRTATVFVASTMTLIDTTGHGMKSALAGIFVGISLVGSAVALASPGRADNSSEFGEKYHLRICNDVGREPTPHGIWAANSILLSQQGGDRYGRLNNKQMQAAIGYAIDNYCPQYSSIYSAYRSRYP
ncbi:hypothetical protein [Mycolicibacter minnesotensis]|nr:hypothetical protein [Mycolicibacter minnesotensis]